MDRTNQVTVLQRALSEVLEELQEPVHILKMDIEGSEWPLLEQFCNGLGQGQVTHVFVETHERFAPFQLMPRVLKLERDLRASHGPSVSIVWP